MGAAAGLGIFISTFLFETDLFEISVRYLMHLEAYEIDELIIPVLVFCLFAYLDQMRKRESQQIELEKLKVYEAMMDSTHHVLNNFINQAQLLKMTAEETPGFDQSVLALYESAQQEASFQIRAMGNISRIDEAAIHESVAPK